MKGTEYSDKLTENGELIGGGGGGGKENQNTSVP